MCTVSMVYDYYAPKFLVTPSTIPSWPTVNVEPVYVEELRKLINEFREALEAAKKVDKLTGQPDCEDPKKANL